MKLPTSLRDVQNQDNLMNEVKIKIDDESAIDILANYNVTGTENQIKADTKVIQAKSYTFKNRCQLPELEKLNQQRQ